MTNQFNGFTREEVDSIYVDEQDRFVISLVVGYHGRPEEVERYDSDVEDSEEPATVFEAVESALELTRDEGCDGTIWCVYDRLTGIMHHIQQDDIDEEILRFRREDAS